MNVLHSNFRAVPIPALIFLLFLFFFFFQCHGWLAISWIKAAKSISQTAQVTQTKTGPASMQLQGCEVCMLPIRSGLLPGNLPGIRQLMTIKYLSYCQSIKQGLIVSSIAEPNIAGCLMMSERVSSALQGTEFLRLVSSSLSKALFIYTKLPSCEKLFTMHPTDCRKRYIVQASHHHWPESASTVRTRNKHQKCVV